MIRSHSMLLGVLVGLAGCAHTATEQAPPEAKAPAPEQQPESVAETDTPSPPAAQTSSCGDANACRTLGARNHDARTLDEACRLGSRKACVESRHLAVCESDDHADAAAAYRQVLEKQCSESVDPACLERLLAGPMDDRVVAMVLPRLKRLCDPGGSPLVCDAFKLPGTESPLLTLRATDGCDPEWAGKAHRVAAFANPQLLGCLSEQAFCGGSGGAFELTGELARDGSVRSIRVDGGSKGIPQPLERCARDVLAALSFPEVSDSCAPVEITFTLAPGSRLVGPPVWSMDDSQRGSLSKDVIKGVMKKASTAARLCHDALVVIDPYQIAPEGKVTVQYLIAPSGEVSWVAIADSELDDALVERCIANELTKLKFPPPAGGGPVMVSYPFVFTSKP